MLDGWQLQLKMYYSLPMMFCIRMFKECNNKSECLDYISKTEDSLCWCCLDYKDSDRVKQLRKERNE